jgi:hypothetical protein
MHLNRSPPALFAISSLLSLGSSLPLLEPLVRRATYSVVPVDGGSAASTAASGGGDSIIYETIFVTQTPAPKTIIETDTAQVTDYVVSTQTVQLSGTVQTLLVTVTPPTTTVTATGYSIIDVTQSQVTITTTPTLSSSTSSVVLTASSSSLETSSSTLQTSSHSYDNGQWHTYYPVWNASSTSTTLQTAATTTAAAATAWQTTDQNLPSAGSDGGYGGFGSLGRRAQETVIPGTYGSLGSWAKKVRREIANLV